MAQQLILVDGSAYLFRSYFSTLSQNLSNDKGFPTGAMFGVINAIKHLQRQYQGAKLIMIFDSKGSNFRHQIYPQYKANRKPLSLVKFCDKVEKYERNKNAEPSTKMSC